MSLPVKFRLEAQAEFHAATAWYESQLEGLGDDFIADVEETLDRVRLYPQSHRVVHRGLRQAVMSRFPYSIIYSEDAVQILVFAVFHARHDPVTWSRRV